MLREVLKQDRLAPLPVEFQMAWMVAYNAGLLDSVASGEIAGFLSRLEQWLSTSRVTLDDKPEDWQQAVKNVL